MSRAVPLLSLVFFFSGMSSLVYQIVWQRLLTIHYGVGAVSITLIVTVYMLGLGLGAVLGGLIAARVRRRLAAYLSIELALGAFGLGSLDLLGWIGAHTAGSDYPVALWFMFLFLCVPTVLMGMTLPLVVQIMTGLLHDFRRSVSFLYFINTLGAAAGALIASYGLISFFGLDVAVLFAATVNFLVAGLILFAAQYADSSTAGGKSGADSPEEVETLGRLAFLTVFVTGFLALGYEIIWLRMVGVLIKDSPYAFSSILAVYLFGVALGSYGMERALRSQRLAGLRDLIFTLQAALAVCAAGSVAAFVALTRWTPLGDLARASFSSDVHPRLPDPELGVSDWSALWSFADVFLWPAFFMLVPTLIMGATFPLLSLLAGRHCGREGRTVGNLYFWNIVGNAVGGFVTGFVLLPLIGTERTLLSYAAAGLLFLLPVRRLFGHPFPPAARFATTGSLLVTALILLPGRGELYERMHISPGPKYHAYFSEGVEGIVLTYVNGDEVQHFIGGQAHGGRPGPIFYCETIEALSFARAPRQILVVGYGTGSTVETALRTPGVERVTLVELNATVMRNLGRIPLFQTLLSDPRLETIFEDGRRYLLRSRERFDAILIDPLRTATAYSGNLYSQEFFELIGRHLTPNGVALVWLDEHRILPATLTRAFRHVRKYRFFALGSNDPLQFRDEKRRGSILETFSPEQRAAIERYADGYEGDEVFLASTLDGTATNRDLRPLTEYYLGYQTRERLSPHGPIASGIPGHPEHR